MPMHQTVNMRANYVTIYADDGDQRLYEAEVEAARTAQSVRGVRYAVAPRLEVATPSGRTLRAGEPCTVDDFKGSPERAAWQILERHVEAGRVIEADVPAGPKAA